MAEKKPISNRIGEVLFSARNWFVPLIAFVIGICLPYLLLRGLTGKEGGKLKEQMVAAPDTMLVKLFNVPGGPAYQGERDQSRLSASPAGSVSGTPGTSTVDQTKKGIVPPVTSFTEPPLGPPPGAWERTLAVLATYPTITILMLLVLLLTLRWIFNYVLRSINPVFLKENDPMELSRLFDQYGSRIAALGSPRKIKRFSNKVRFQYYVLREKNPGGSFADYFIEVLLAIEKNNILYEIDSYSEFEKWFRDSLGDKQVRPELLKEIYVLNRGNVI